MLHLESGIGTDHAPCFRSRVDVEAEKRVNECFEVRLFYRVYWLGAAVDPPPVIAIRRVYANIK